MAHFDITYTCGHEATVNITGPHWHRERRIAFLERGECFECYKSRTTEVAHEQAEEMELPALAGREKQITWAESLRIKKIAEIEAEVERLVDSKDYRLILQVVEKISNETSAKQWIEWRDELPKTIINDLFQAMRDAPTEAQKQQKLACQKEADAIRRAAQVEATVRPETSVSEMVAEITLNGKIISITFPEKNEDFRKLVKSMGYTWNEGRWERTIGALAGTPSERVVEMGHTLLSRGFLVRVYDDVLRARIVVGDFEPEHTRWIVVLTDGDYVGWLKIKWGRNEDYYDVARRLPNSLYRRPGIVVPPAQFAQILDFAERYDFRLSSGAQTAIQEAQEDKAAMLMVSKEPVVMREKTVASDVPPVLAIPEQIDIDDSLRDVG